MPSASASWCQPRLAIAGLMAAGLATGTQRAAHRRGGRRRLSALAGAGAAGTQTGLLFVAVSINLSRILEFPHLPDRAAGTLGLVMTILLTRILMLVPGRSRAGSPRPRGARNRNPDPRAGHDCWCAARIAGARPRVTGDRHGPWRESAPGSPPRWSALGCCWSKSSNYGPARGSQSGRSFSRLIVARDLRTAIVGDLPARAVLSSYVCPPATGPAHS